MHVCTRISALSISLERDELQAIRLQAMPLRSALNALTFAWRFEAVDSGNQIYATHYAPADRYSRAGSAVV